MSDFFTTGEKEFLHNLSIDCVIFGYHERTLKVLLLKWKNVEKWTVAGGFIRLEEALNNAAERITKERTNLDSIYLRQFQTFGDPARTYRTQEEIDMISTLSGKKLTADYWLFKRTVSIGYYAVTEYSKVQPQPDEMSEYCQWFNVHEIPPMVFDHALIVKEALKALQEHIYSHPIGYNLLPEKFTLPEIHDLYETILEKQLDRRNFSKKLLMHGIIKKLDERRSIGAHRSPFLYKFDKRKYEKALKDGIALAF